MECATLNYKGCYTTYYADGTLRINWYGEEFVIFPYQIHHVLAAEPKLLKTGIITLYDKYDDYVKFTTSTGSSYSAIMIVNYKQKDEFYKAIRLLQNAGVNVYSY